ncbi:hypothetical protein J3Q64DRAFT_1848454 [Phycomyces blakesleeanus]|uniref:F-box domain-containing protein n=1 Tax=Phycomyces blakesleeanus TaxID=4837 RepID=A0ABR3B0S5_PHYBL
MIERLPFEILTNISERLLASEKRTCSTYSKDVDTIKFKDSKHTNTKIQQLIEIFPNVKNFSYASTGAYHYLVDVDLSRWKLLSRMTITWGLRNRLNILDNLFVLLSDLPSLVHLGIEPGYHTHPNRPITWRDIEKIHLGLPRLKSLKIRSDMDRIGPTEIGEIKQATPTNTMETVDYASMGFNLLWMQYLAIKYPKLKTLRLTVDQNTPLSIDLEKIETTHFTNYFDTESPPNETACAALFTTTLKSLHILQNDRRTSGISLFLHDSDVKFSKLVHLNIYTSGQPSQINNILNICPALKVLEIKSELKYTEERRPSDILNHGLQRLKLTQTSLDIEWFESISNCCRNLKYLSLEDISNKSTPREMPYCLPISMPFTRLSTCKDNTLADNETCFTEYFKDVDAIRFEDSEDTNTTIQQLIELFPNVKNFSYSAAGDFQSLIDADLSSWKSLTHMTINWIYRHNVIIPENLFVSLSALPSLVHLEIKPGYRTHPNRPVTWRDIEKLHLHLPRLKSLKVSSDICVIEPNDIDELKNTEPANNIETVDYVSMGFSIPWMYYLALKYPKLKTLNLTVEEDVPVQGAMWHRYSRPEPIIEKMTVPSNLSGFFPYLKNIYTSNKRKGRPEFSVLYGQIFKSGAKLEKMETSHFTNSDDTKFPLNEMACAALFAETLKNLRIFRNYSLDFEIVLFIHDPGVEFSKLVRLHIYSTTQSFQVENILSACLALKVLGINSHLGCKIKKRPSNVLKHGLRQLRITGASLDTEWFEYISDCLRDLKYLSLEDISIKSTPREMPYCLPISMPFTRLSTLSLLRIQMSYDSKFIFGTGYSRKDNTFTDNETCFTEVYLNYLSTKKSRFVPTFDKNSYDSNSSCSEEEEYCGDKRVYKRDNIYYCTIFQCKSIKQVIISHSSFYSCSTPIFTVQRE